MKSSFITLSIFAIAFSRYSRHISFLPIISLTAKTTFLISFIATGTLVSFADSYYSLNLFLLFIEFKKSGRWTDPEVSKHLKQFLFLFVKVMHDFILQRTL